MKKTLLLIIPVAFTIGSIIAFFLWLLHAVIQLRFQNPWLLFLLPLAGLVIHFIYQSVGKSSEKGNNLIMEEIHQPAAGMPGSMGPIILLTTVITHLFGGSAGREGTAVQIGGSIAAVVGKFFKLHKADLRILLTCGIAAGFGAVFGTPFTGAIFAVEVLTLGKIKYKALLPALFASFIADVTVSLWGVHHTIYSIDAAVKVRQLLFNFLPSHLGLLFKIFVASIAFGLVSLLFSEMTHKLKNFFLRVIKIKWMIPVVGGIILIVFTYLNGKPDYLSLGVDAEHPGAITIPSAFQEGGAATWSWLWKTLYTATTLATGFKGGEVTPLFYIGATLGNTLSLWLNAPVSLFAALGFIAVFAGATNTPLACTVMGMELFGAEYTLFFALACFTAYFFSGHSGIYSAQRKSTYIGYAKIKVGKYCLSFKSLDRLIKKKFSTKQKSQ